MKFSSIDIFKSTNGLTKACQGVPSAVYIGSPYEEGMAAYMKEKYELVFSVTLTNLGIPFYYLPEALKRGHLNDCLAYNSPSLSLTHEERMKTIERFNERILRQNGLDLKSCGIAIMDFNDPTALIHFYPMESSRAVPDQLNEWTRTLFTQVKVNYTSIGRGEMFRGRVFRRENEPEIYVDCPQEMVIKFSKVFDQNEMADEKFDTEYVHGLQAEILERINILKERGFMHLIAEIAEEIQQELPKALPPKLSRLYIDREHRIFLTDYGNREIEMGPLPKTIFLLFLNHPEGILFKELIDYHKEILEIYKRITPREDYNAIRSSIRALTDPMSNSINEKCSRIRNAILEVIAPDLAEHYCVKGKRGEPKRITLDRSLVIFEP